MQDAGEIKMLADGLRALDRLARVAPVDLAGFAEAIGLSLPNAAALLETFEQSGYAATVPHGQLYVPTRLTLEIFAHANPLGALATIAIDPVAALARELDAAATLSIRRGAEMLCCVASHALDASSLRPGGRQGLQDGIVGLLQLACAQSLAHDPAGLSIVRAGEGIDRAMAAHDTVAVPVVTDQNDVAVLAVHADDVAARAPALVPAMRRAAQAIVRAQRDSLRRMPRPQTSLMSLATLH
jgi:hypothetical protein